MKVECEIEEVPLQGGSGPVDGVQATCSRCDHQVESFGTSERSVRRCLALMREECPRAEENYYTAGGDEDD